MLSLLYDIFISPLMVGMNFVLVNAYSVLHSYGLAILVLSLVVNTVLLPLYHMADKWQQEERAKQDKMADKVAEIKQAFQGQERFMMLKTLYRQNHYHPIMAVRNSVGFLIQVPFFFAAYQLLSHFPALNGQSFGPFANLGLPDGLLTIGDLHINVMPFVMTGINLLSAFVYTKGLSSKDKIQLYVFAGIFLVLLYTSPVGLVLYWTLNNVYSLGKNLVSEFLSILKNNKYILLTFNVITTFCCVLLLYSILSFLFYKILPNGVTKDFFIRSFSYYSVVPILYACYIIIKLIYNSENNFNKRRENISIGEIAFIIIPMIPLSQYIISNANILTSHDVLYSFIIMLIIIGVIVIIIPYYLSSIIDKKILQSAILAIVSLIAFMPLVSSIFHFAGTGSLTKLLPLLLILVTLAIVIVFFSNKKLVVFCVVLLVSNSISVYMNSDNIETGKSQKINMLQFPKFKMKNNVYLLTYDAYVSNETMRKYGINNKKQEVFLKDNGFTIYPEVYSIAAASTSTMGRVLNITSSNNGVIESVAGDGFVFDIFKQNSYSTAGYFENAYFFTGAENKYNSSYPAVKNVNPLSMIYTSILSGYFRFDLGFSDFSRKDFLYNKYKYLNSIKNNSFIYTHTGPGHSQNSGQCLNNEIDLFKDRLDIANNEMVKDIKTIEAKDPSAIIIINGDHGPYLTKNCTSLTHHYSSSEIDRLDMQDRYGTFLAIKLPNGDVIGHSKLNILQDVFPEVFNYLTKSNHFDSFKLKTRTIEDVTSGVYIDNGIIHGGKNDGEKLFLGENHAK